MQKREKPSMWSDVEGPIDDHIPKASQGYHGAANQSTKIRGPAAAREFSHRHYSRVISLALSALDDGSQSPPPSREFIEWLLSKLGYHCETWTRLTDEELVDFIGCDGRLNEEITRGRILEKIRKQRGRLLKWQEKPDNPIIIDHRVIFEHAEDSEPGRPKGKSYSEYQTPFGELVAEIVEDAPAGTRDDKLKRIVKLHVAEYLKRFSGTTKRNKKKRQHSPESDLKRAATVARKAFEREEKKAGRPSAINAFSGAFTPVFSGVFNLSISDIARSKPAETNDLAAAPLGCEEVTLVPHTNREFCHVSEEKSVAKLSASPPPLERGSHPPEGEEIRAAAAVAAGRGCDPSPGPHALDGCRAIAAFRSVSCDKFEWFFVDPETDKKTGAYHEAEADEFGAEIGELIGDAERGGVSLVARVRGPVLQIDDCNAEAALLLEPFSVVVIETSKDNFQCWLAFHDEWDKADASARLFLGLRKLKLQGNHGAGGATRWPGSINQKPSRNGFRVRVDFVNAGRFVTPSELDDAGLLGDPPPPVELDWQPNGEPRAWPDYDRCLKDKNGDRSNADAQFVYFSLTRNRNPKEIGEKLAQVSAKAKEEGEKYINRTIAKGVAYFNSLEVANDRK